MRAATLTAMLLLPVGSCALSSRQRAGDLQSARRAAAEIMAADQAFAQAASGNLLSAFRSNLGPNAVFLEPGEPILQTAAEAIAALERADPSGTGVATWKPVSVGASADGNDGYSFGYGSVTGPFGTDGRSATIQEKYISYWRRDGAGRWSVVAHVRAFSRAAPNASALNRAVVPRISPRAFAIGDTATGQRLLLGVDASFAETGLRAGLHSAAGEFVDSGGAILSGESFIVFGRDSVREAFGSFSPGTQLLWTPTRASIAGSGDLGFTTGNAELRAPRGDSIVRSPLKYLTVWMRGDDGRWRFVIDGGNAGVPH
jgi:ketosteroid isomerase-like protein